MSIGCGDDDVTGMRLMCLQRVYRIVRRVPTRPTQPSRSRRAVPVLIGSRSRPPVSATVSASLARLSLLLRTRKYTFLTGYNAVVTCEIKVFQNSFSFCRRQSKIILFQRLQTCLKLFKIISEAYCSS